MAKRATKASRNGEARPRKQGGGTPSRLRLRRDVQRRAAETARRRQAAALNAYIARFSALALPQWLDEVEELIGITPRHDVNTQHRGNPSAWDQRTMHETRLIQEKLGRLIGAFQGDFARACAEAGIASTPRRTDSMMKLFHEETILEIGNPFEWLALCRAQCGWCQGAALAAIRAIRSVQHPVDEWITLHPAQQAAIRYLLQRERGETVVKLLELAPGLHPNGEHRRLVHELIETLLRREGQGFRLLRVPTGTPNTIERHPSWRSPEVVRK